MGQLSAYSLAGVRLCHRFRVVTHYGSTECGAAIVRPEAGYAGRKRRIYLERREKLVSGLDLQNSIGVEIGALDKPVIARQDGEIIYVDHTDTASLRAKYKNDPNVDVEKIVTVDAVWGTQSLQEAVGLTRKVDYIVASHVIEHVPDLITWLEELRAVLKPGGEVRLAVPDRRFTFDYLRRETTLADVLNAYIARTRIPLPIAILDFFLNVATVSNIDAWEGKLDTSRPRLMHSVDQAITVARDSFENRNYHDVHCWVFTPRSFAHLFAEAADAGLIRFSCNAFHDTARYHIEFCVTLRVCDNRAETARSWYYMEQLAANQESGSSSALGPSVAATGLAHSVGIIESQLERLEISATEQRALLAKLNEWYSERTDDLQRKLNAVYDSTSWRLTGPLRAIANAVRRCGNQHT
jgi:SAM-dependent methyltransferase